MTYDDERIEDMTEASRAMRRRRQLEIEQDLQEYLEDVLNDRDDIEVEMGGLRIIRPLNFND